MGNTIYTYQPIDAGECMGDSLQKINNNNFKADEAVGVLETRIASTSGSLLTIVQGLSGKVTFTEVESVIGSTETINGFIGKTTKARGTQYYPSNVAWLADFNWQKSDGTSELVRMESVNPATYAPWQNFFPYKPSGKLVTTKMNVIQIVQDTSGSNESMHYVLHVNWPKTEVFLTGGYHNATGAQYNFVFNKRWNYNTVPEISIRSDNNVAGAYYDLLGDRNSTLGNPLGYLTSRVTTSGIEKIPVWNYPGYAETSNVSIFIENTFNY